MSKGDTKRPTQQYMMVMVLMLQRSINWPRLLTQQNNQNKQRDPGSRALDLGGLYEPGDTPGGPEVGGIDKLDPLAKQQQQTYSMYQQFAEEPEEVKVRSFSSLVKEGAVVVACRRM